MALTIDDFLRTKYVKHGRVVPDLDCWGLVRLARADLFGQSLLPSFDGIDPMDKRGLTAAAIGVRQDGGFAEVPARPGTIATAWCARTCVHVGIVVEADGRLWVLETDEAAGPMMVRMQIFESRYTRVIYYDDQGLS